MIYRLTESECRNLRVSSHREWLLTNGIGGYAMGTVSGINTRRYHGLLIAAHQPPAARRLHLANLEVDVRSGGTVVGLSANQYPGAVFPEGYQLLESFAVGLIARWVYRVGRTRIQKEIALAEGENAVRVRFTHVDGPGVDLAIRPLVADRDHHGEFRASQDFPVQREFRSARTRIQGESSLVIHHPGASMTPVEGWYYRFEHHRERDRGLPDQEDLYCPCQLQYHLPAGVSVEFIATSSDDDPARFRFPSEEESPDGGWEAMLRDGARPFLVRTATGLETIIAGYPWFGDWGRDTMIALPGLCLANGDLTSADAVLRRYAAAERNGLIPNRFLDSGDGQDYHTVDATLWFVNAVYRRLELEWSASLAEELMPVLHRVFRAHMRGTDFGIAVDPVDGLLRQGADGVQLTWMDAKIGDWVVTPRHGKPVEIAALWLNALRCVEWIASRLERHEASMYAEQARRGESTFESKFWHEVRGHYMDTADPNDASLRPNQVIAMALPFSPCDPKHARQALRVVADQLLTPRGLRTLGPQEPGYVGTFEGSMAQRDAAYHQGTAWPWLLGPYATALATLGNDPSEARRLLREARSMFNEYGMGGVAEVYDGDAPQRAAGCPWQAWSTGELARAWWDLERSPAKPLE